MEWSSKDIEFMEIAINLAKSVKGITFPNPAVGAVVVSSGVIVGKGATEECGGDHAEKKAIKSAGDKCRGADLYVTLEPCSHYGRTPPCTTAILRAGISRVFIAVKDPNPIVNGSGIEFLRKNGIEVFCGLMERDATRLNEEFFWSVQTNHSWITLKLALTLDGRLADFKSHSKWITTEASRKYVHELRKEHAAIAVGHGTILKDNPSLDVRLVSGRSPVRIILADNFEFSGKFKIERSASEIRTIVVKKGNSDEPKTQMVGNVEVWHSGQTDEIAHWNYVTRKANSEGLTSILIEGGSKIASSLLENKLVNRLYLFYGNKILGGGLDSFSFFKPLSIEKPYILHDYSAKVIDDNIVVTGLPAKEI